MALYHLCTDTNHKQANKSSKGMKLLMQTLSHVTLETFIVLMLKPGRCTYYKHLLYNLGSLG